MYALSEETTAGLSCLNSMSRMGHGSLVALPFHDPPVLEIPGSCKTVIISITEEPRVPLPVKFQGHRIPIALPAHLSSRLQGGVLNLTLRRQVRAKEGRFRREGCLRARSHSQPLSSLAMSPHRLGANSTQQFVGWKGKAPTGTASESKAPLWIRCFLYPPT